MEDGRNAEVHFFGANGKTMMVETFETESETPIDMQRAGWQAILNNFKKKCEDLWIAVSKIR